jgi:hypothetical protein
MSFKLAIRKIMSGLLSKIIQYCGPATWAEDGSGHYHTPIYMLSHIIRLQVVVEIITNKTSKALNLLAKQNTKMCNAIYQNRLALNYLLASKGGVCKKLNLSNCCLQIDDKEQVINKKKKKSQTKEKACPCPHPDLERMGSQ